MPPDPASPSLQMQSQEYLFGDWGGERSALAEKGITFDFFYISDMQANPSSGLQQTEAGWERIRGTIDINFDRMIESQGQIAEETVPMKLTWHGNKGWSGYLAGKNSTGR